jgi:hypothetical protein
MMRWIACFFSNGTQHACENYSIKYKIHTGELIKIVKNVLFYPNGLFGDLICTDAYMYVFCIPIATILSTVLPIT